MGSFHIHFFALNLFGIILPSHFNLKKITFVKLVISDSIQFSYLFFKLTSYQHVYMYIRTAISRNDKQCIITILEQHVNWIIYCMIAWLTYVKFIWDIIALSDMIPIKILVMMVQYPKCVYFHIGNSIRVWNDVGKWTEAKTYGENK